MTSDFVSQRKGNPPDRQLTAIIESSDDAIISKTLDGTIMGWNPAAERIFGYTAEEAIGRPISMLVPPDRANEEPEILRQLGRGEKVDHLETVRVRRDGKRIAVVLTISPIVDEHGKVVAACKIARDISRQKECEEAVRVERERLLVTLSSIGDGVIVTDVKGCIEFVNPVAETLTGWSWREVRGRPLESIFYIVNEQSRRPVENPARKALRDGTITNLAKGTLLVRRDGQELAINDSAAPIRDSNEQVTGVILVFRDVTTQNSIEHVQARLSSIVENSDDAIISKDLNGQITSWNKGAESIFGYTAEEAVGRPITMLIPAELLGEEVEILGRLRRGERLEHYETVRLSKDRRRINVSLTISPVLDGEGRVVGVSKIARDISERKRAEHELEEAHARLQGHAEELERQVSTRTAELKESLEELETFASSLSHDLKAPIRAISGYVEVLQEDYGAGLPPEGQQLMDRVIKTCRRMSRFVDNVLAYAQLRRGTAEIVPVQLESLVPRVMDEYPHAHQAGAEIRIEHPLLDVLGHEGLLTQALANLVSNAVKFVAPGRTPMIRIWTEPKGERVRIWVEDNGIGIREADRVRLFNLFTRLQGAGNYEGSGVGLAVVQRAVRRMGGSTGVESEFGKGSRFWIELLAPN